MSWNPVSSIENIVSSIASPIKDAVSSVGTATGLNNVWSGIKAPLETAAMGVADYYTGGLASLADPMLSQGSQAQLDTNWGKMAQLGAGITGAVQGNTIFQGGQGANSSGLTPAQTASTGQIVNPAYTGVGGSVNASLTSMANTGMGWANDTLGTSFTPYSGASGGVLGLNNTMTPEAILNSGVAPEGGIGAGVASAGGGQFGWGSPMNLLQLGGVGYSMYGANKMSGLAQQEINAANAQRNAVPLPTAANVTSLPGYQSGMDAVTRSMISQGYQGSGNMAAALQSYGQTAYQQAMQNYQTQQGIANQTVQTGGQMLASGVGGVNSALATMGMTSLLASNPVSYTHLTLPTNREV